MSDWDGRGLITTDWVQAHLDDPSVRTFDATVHLRPSTPGPYRIESGRSDYEGAHIPGAAFVDLATELSDPDAALRFTRPATMPLARALGAAGVGHGVRLVIYSSTTPMWATRLWWMLRAAGFKDAAVLDGGLARWIAERRPVEARTQRYPPSELTLMDQPGAWADKSEVLSAIGDGSVCTINALSPGVHSGEAAISYGRKGHIRGSRNVPYAALLDSEGRYRSDSDLRALFEAVGAFERDRVICYCGGGISATMDALALTRLGHPSVAVYDGSMSEWAAEPEAPMETGVS